MEKTTQPDPAPNSGPNAEPIESLDAVRAQRGLRPAGQLLLGAAAVLLSGTLLGLPGLSAQQPAPASAPAVTQEATSRKAASSTPSAQKLSHAAAAHRHIAQRTAVKRTAARRNPSKRESRQPGRAVKTSSAPAAPPLPNWPADRQPNPATVVWDSQGLEIQASNSSLDQILHDVETDTGVKVNGFNQDQRVFGTYGPGPAREVLSKLLDGSGYNVIMVGGAGDQAPQQIVLSTMVAVPPSPANANPGTSSQQQDAQEQEDSGSPQYPMPPRSPNDSPQVQQLQQQMRRQMEQEIQQRMQMREQEEQ